MLSFYRFSLFGRAAGKEPARAKSAAVFEKKKRRNAESRVRDALASRIPGSRTEVPCSAGVVDVVTPGEIIEVKRAPLWKAALGQALAYSGDFPGRAPRVHLFGPEAENFRLAAVTCERFGVRLTATGADGEDVDVWLGDRHRNNRAQVTGGVLRDEVGRGGGMPGGVEAPAEDRDGVPVERGARGTDVEGA